MNKGTIDDPCYETIECGINEEIDPCANLICYGTCDSERSKNPPSHDLVRVLSMIDLHL